MEIPILRCIARRFCESFCRFLNPDPSDLQGQRCFNVTHLRYLDAMAVAPDLRCECSVHVLISDTASR